MNQIKRLANSKILKVTLQRLLRLSSHTCLYCPPSLTAYNSIQTSQYTPLINVTKKTFKPNPSHTCSYPINRQVVHQAIISGYSTDKKTFLVTKFSSTEFSFKNQNDNAVILVFLNKQNDIIHKDKSTPHNSNNKFAIHSQYSSLGKYYAQ